MLAHPGQRRFERCHVGMKQRLTKAQVDGVGRLRS
jgi:hypothetical protein